MQSSILRAAAFLLLMLGLYAKVVAADEPPPAQRSADDDPLLAAARKLQQELQALRGEIHAARGTPTPRPAPPADQPADDSYADDLPGVQPPPAPLRLPRSPARTAAAGPIRPADHWSLRPLQPPVVPAVTDPSWPRDDLDRFIMAKLDGAGLEPAADADRYTLLRRIALDLTGLPPTIAETEAFVRDASPLDMALVQVVDRYLASPRFGERWGRHWLDVVRYADSVGRTWNAPFTYAWRYRDWVIDALNKDKPYDRFLLEQLAGDLLPAATVEERRENLTATGFLTLSSLSLNDGRLEGFLMDRVDEQLDVTTRAVLGLTVACARCHDHKTDPITMRDYYALAGIFYSTRVLSGQGHQGDLGPGGYVDAEMLLRLPGLPGSVPPRRAIHSMADYREASQQSGANPRYTTDPDLAMGVLDGEVRDCDLRIGGDAYDRGAAPPRGEHQIPGLPLLPAVPADQSGRLELAQWLVAADQPLTPRVQANRVWQHLFGRGLVRTVDDFGSTGEPPTHPELLDHLATRLVRDGWSTKGLVRAIVLSRTYRQSTAASPSARAKDPGNEFYGRMQPRRLEMEVLRDGLLHVAGRLQFERPEGIQVAGTGGKGRTAVVRSLLPLDAPYRTVYLPVLRGTENPLHDTFDFPDPCQLSGQRQVTTVATQALFFLNSELAIDCAADAAERLLADPQLDDAGRVRRAYLALYGREASADDVDAALALMDQLQPPAQERDPKRYRWTTLFQALFASGEFRYVF